ncbi:MAG: FAD-dependent oxidoreductase [Clostridia bacterium]|nr:FAD-dependent oxidoreductase [Clostridia bacterium]
MNILEGREFDVIVAGAGCAGFCAAVQAGRSGLKVGLFEHFAMPGGSLTVLGSNSIDQFNNPHRPKGSKMVIGGIGWEFVNELAKRGFAEIPDMDAPYRVHWQYGVKVNPIAAAQCMDDFLLQANVSINYRQGVVAVETAKTPDGIRIDSVIVTTKSGLVRHRAKMFIDCTGDGDICVWAGAEYMISDTLQPGTMRLYPTETGNDSNAFENADKAWSETVKNYPELREMMCSGRFESLLAARGDNTNHICGLNTADSESRSETEIRSRRDIVKLLSVMKENGAPMDIMGSAPESAPRESRRIIGDTVMTGDDYLQKRLYDDAVCYTYWFIDIHRDNGPSEIVYLKDEKTPSISLGAMRPKGLTNVYVAGRCVSADRQCQSAIRVKASCMAMGQAAGAAVAVAFRNGEYDTRKVDVNEVKEYLKTQGAIVPEKSAE